MTDKNIYTAEIENLLNYIYRHFCASLIIFLRDIEENKSGCFY